MREIFVRTNRSRGRGSMTLAARTFAMSGECSEELRHAILKPRASKHTLTRTIRNALATAPALVEHHRSPTEAKLGGMYCPGSLRMARGGFGDEPRRMMAGERQSWDDASINFLTCVPWPWGGDRCADRFGVKLGRFQLLAGIDDASDFCPGFSFVMRPLQSYRAEDTTAAQFRVWRDSYLPAAAVVEGGVWQSHRAMEFYRRVHVEPVDAKGRPHSKLVENYWNRLWSVLSLQPGQIGRYRGEMERESDLALRAQNGRLDPREYFPMLTQGLDALQAAISYLNAEPVESKKYGRWVPQERHRDDLAAHPRHCLTPDLAWTVAPEQHVRVTRRGMVEARVESPLGGSLPYHFATEALWEFEGCRVRVHFDPFEAPCTAAIALAEDHAGLKAGHVIALRASCLDDAPAVLRSAEGYGIEFDAAGLARAIEIRKAVSKAVRTEYRAIGFGGRRLAASSESRDGLGGVSRLEFSGGVAGSSPAAIATGRGASPRPASVALQRRMATRLKPGGAADGIAVDPALVADVDAYMRDQARSRLEEAGALL